MSELQQPKVISGPGVGDLFAMGIKQLVVDTGDEHFPVDTPIDVMLIPAGALEPIAAIQIPPGAMIAFVNPALAAQIRAQVKKRPPVHGPVIPSTMKTGAGG